MDQHPGDPKEPLPPMSERRLKTNFSPELQDYLERARAAKKAYQEAWQRGENPPMWTALLPRDYLTLLKPLEEEDRAREFATSMVGVQRLLRHPLNLAAARLLNLQGGVVFAGTLPLSQAVIEGLQHWDPKGDRGPQTLFFLAELGEAKTPEKFVEALQPFMCPLAWKPERAKTMGLLPYGMKSLEQYTPTRLMVEARRCHGLPELMDLLERQEAWTYEMGT
jgi:hypothetical protein